jgi:hypothetical protein
MFLHNMGLADVLRIIMHFFFYAIMCHPDPNRWSSRDIDTLYEHFDEQYLNVAMDQDTFGAQLKE